MVAAPITSTAPTANTLVPRFPARSMPSRCCELVTSASATAICPIWLRAGSSSSLRKSISHQRATGSELPRSSPSPDSECTSRAWAGTHPAWPRPRRIHCKHQRLSFAHAHIHGCHRHAVHTGSTRADSSASCRSRASSSRWTACPDCDCAAAISWFSFVILPQCWWICEASAHQLLVDLAFQVRQWRTS